MTQTDTVTLDHLTKAPQYRDAGPPNPALLTTYLLTYSAKAIAVVTKTGGNGGLRRDFSHADMRVSGLDELRISQLKEVAGREPEEEWVIQPELQPEPFWGPGD